MTIKEVEERTGLARSNVRFYEKEKLIEPSRNASNGYRDYSEKDIEDIKKIAYLRTLGISVEDIRSIVSGKLLLYDAIEKQCTVLQGEIADLGKARVMCERMLAEDERVDFDGLKVEKYVTELQDYWEDNESWFRLDCVSFLYIWGDTITWMLIAAASLLVSLIFYGKLPPEIPIQWSDGMVSSFANKNFIFVYPAICIAVRLWVRPCIRVKLGVGSPYNPLITEYLTNYACFVSLSVEIFTILFIYGVVKSVVILLAMDTFVLLGVLAVGIVKMNLKSAERD